MARWRLIWRIAVVLAAVCGLVAATPRAHRKHRKARPRHVSASRSSPIGMLPIELVESVPAEYDIGNPILPAARDVWVQMIRGAKTSIDLEQFYLSDWPGEPLRKVLVAIGEAARRGVQVRLLLDARFHNTYPLPADSLDRLPNVTVRLIDFGRITGGVQHSKYFIVDDREIYLGSQNFDWRSLSHIHELGVRMRDPEVVRAYRPVFETDWAASVDPASWTPDTARVRRAIVTTPVDAPPPAPLVVLQSPRDTVYVWPSYSPRGVIPDSTRWDRDAIVRLLDSASREIVVQTMTYAVADRGLEDPALDAALRRAAARGVRVRLIVADWEADSKRIESVQGLARVPNVEVRMSTVPEWSRAYIPFARVEHCKYAVVDSLAMWVGTSNWEPGYFHTVRNLGVTLQNRRLAAQACRMFDASWRAPGAAPLRPDSTYAPKPHGSTPPEGRKVYGR